MSDRNGRFWTEADRLDTTGYSLQQNRIIPDN
jgi:hypothetical protein